MRWPRRPMQPPSRREPSPATAAPTASRSARAPLRCRSRGDDGRRTRRDGKCRSFRSCRFAVVAVSDLPFPPADRASAAALLHRRCPRLPRQRGDPAFPRKGGDDRRRADDDRHHRRYDRVLAHEPPDVQRQPLRQRGCGHRAPAIALRRSNRRGSAPHRPNAVHRLLPEPGRRQFRVVGCARFGDLQHRIRAVGPRGEALRPDRSRALPVRMDQPHQQSEMLAHRLRRRVGRESQDVVVGRVVAKEALRDAGQRITLERCGGAGSPERWIEEVDGKAEGQAQHHVQIAQRARLAPCLRIAPGPIPEAPLQEVGDQVGRRRPGGAHAGAAAGLRRGPAGMATREGCGCLPGIPLRRRGARPTPREARPANHWCSGSSNTRSRSRTCRRAGRASS